MGLNLECEGNVPHERECPNPGADRKVDVRCTGRDGLLAVEAEGDRAGRLAVCGCDNDVDGAFDRRDGGGSRYLASSNVGTLRPG